MSLVEAIKYNPPPYLIDLVRSAPATEDLSLSEEAISKVAGLLFNYQNNQVTETQERESNKKRNQEKWDKQLRNASRKLDSQLHRLLADSVLSKRLYNAYEEAEASEIVYFRPTEGGSDILVGKVEPPEDPEEALLDVRRQLSLLVDVLDSIETKESPYSTNRRTQQALSLLIIQINELISAYVGKDSTKSIRADYIRDFLALIEVPRERKTIQNLLS